MNSIDINNTNTIVAILSGILSIFSLLIHTFKKKLEHRSDVHSIINKNILNKEKESIDSYFQSLTYEELLNIKENPNKIDKRIHNMIENISKNTPILSATKNILSEITRKDRYQLSKFLLSKVNNSTSSRKTFRWLLILLSNYLFYLSKFLFYLFVYALLALLFALPIYYIITIIIIFYVKLDMLVFFMSCFLLVLCLFVFGQKD